MKSDFSSYWFTPESFHQRAEQFSQWRWRLLMWSALCFSLYLLLSSQVSTKTPDALVWLTLFILFSALQALVLGSFVFFFRKLPSTQANSRFWFTFYRSVEWCETLLFTFLLPLPALTFVYALYQAWL